VEIEAEMYDVGSGPLARVLGIFNKFASKATGSIAKGFLVVTDKRIITTSIQKFCCVFTRSKAVKYVLPNSVYRIGWAKEGTIACCCPVINLWYSTRFGDGQDIRLIGADETTAMKACDAFFKAVSQSNALIRQ
jgi:hypothetical protein